MVEVENKEGEGVCLGRRVCYRKSHRRCCPWAFIVMGKECVCVCVCVTSDMCVPEIWCGCPFQSQAGQVHGSIHQQEENGHNTGDGVEFP